jgi:hypothetical protein
MPIAFTLQQTGSQSADPAAQIRQQVQQQIQDQLRAAREQARIAHDQAMRAAAQGTPVVFAPPPVPGIPREAVTLGIAFFVMVVVIVVGLPIARALARLLDRRSAAPAVSADLTAQLQRIEQTVESMSIEVERISEAQRYMARLEAGRQAEPAGEKQ